MGDRPPNSTSGSLKRIEGGLRKYYPSIVKSLGEQDLPTAQYEQATKEAIAPREQALSSSLYNQYAPQYAQTGAGIDLSAINGGGGQAVRSADALDRGINPEYFSTRAGSSDKLAQLLSGLDPNRLTGAEQENVARGLARSNYASGETAVPSNQGAIKAALTYGNALNEKRNTVANAINTATQALPQFKGGDVFGQATGGARSGANVFAGGQGFGGSSNQAGQQGGQSVLGLTSGLQQLKMQISGQQRDALDRYQNTGIGNIICWILLEAFDGKLPAVVEKWRNAISHNYNFVKQYNKIASKVVPLMRKDATFKAWVKQNFALPVLSHCQGLYAKTN